MKTILHPADTRGHANHGWLDTYHTFSFANYNNPERVHFGALRVFNDDTVLGGYGFAKHPHDNMEIISIPLEGDLEHTDSIGNTAVIRKGDVQVMSAGTGIAHSEKNHSEQHPTNFLQIWVIPNKRGAQPRYGQTTFDTANRHNRLQLIVSPNPADGATWVNQNAWFHLAHIEAGVALEDYAMKGSGNGVYAFVIAGNVTVAGQTLARRDGFGIWEADGEPISIVANEDTELLLMEVPMIF